ncbi:MAG: hypothetical protein PHQ76_00705 [Caldisericia bacterium]|jgi:hypothetical protein|nr:hypothetical protein [Caldisericia bacterium]
MTNKNLVIPQGEEVKAEVIRIILDQLGIEKTAYFIKEFMYQKVDYLEMKEKMFGEKTAEEIYTEIKEKK